MEKSTFFLSAQTTTPTTPSISTTWLSSLAFLFLMIDSGERRESRWGMLHQRQRCEMSVVRGEGAECGEGGVWRAD